MSEHSLYRRIIAGEAGLWVFPVRAMLRVLEGLYARGVALRNTRYDRSGPRAVLDIPVISVGNLTVGGTGKTPFVIELVKRLDRMGLSPAVVSRGYKAAEGQPNDEERLIRESCPSVVCICDPDRAAAGQFARTKFGADVIVLDDGFQHRQLARTLDIVLIDATCPFGFGHLLPRGLLREPVGSLRRAQIVVLTRCDQVSSAALSRVEARLRNVECGRGKAEDGRRNSSFTIPPSPFTILQCTHRVTSVDRLDDTPLASPLEGKRAVVFAGIGHPGAFLTTVRSLGVEVVGQRFWPDHHRYTPRDISTLRRPGRFPPHDLLITTEKDAVKLVALDGVDLTGVAVVRVAIDFKGDGGTMLQTALERALGKS
ncbi:MAG: tetraacyldisaccharide 4'-kinase [Phycisphaerae bacterium]